MASPIKAELKVANEAEAQAGWDRVGVSPSDLAIWFTKVFSITITGLDIANPIYVGSSEPESDADKGKPYFNSSTPASINVPLAGGTYATFYQYPPLVPLLWTGGDDKRPSYLRKLSPTELTNMGLTNPEDSEYYYVIFEP
jgi:hypothetical protein